MAPSRLVKALVKRTRRPEQVQAKPPSASETLVKRTTQPEIDEDQPASSSSHVDNIISHSAAALKIMDGLSEFAGIPALKVVVGALARFLELVDQMRKNKEGYLEFALSVYETIKAAKDEIIQFQESIADLENLTKSFMELQAELLEMVYDVERLMKQSFLKRALSTSTTQDTLRKYQDRLNRKTSIFVMRNTVAARARIEICHVEESLFGDYTKVLLGQMELLDNLPRCKPIETNLPPGEWHESEYVVNIGGERKTARFYARADGIKRLKEELKIISRFRHPQLGQLYGICRSAEHPALIFHQEMRNIDPYRHGHVLSPIETIYFIHDCIRAFVNARDYLITQCSDLKLIETNGFLRRFVMNLNNGSYGLEADMRLGHNGRIVMSLAVVDALPPMMHKGTLIVKELQLHLLGWPIHKIYPAESTHDTRTSSIISSKWKTPTITEKLTEFHSRLFALGEGSYGYIGYEDLGTIRCRQTTKWGCGMISYSNPLDFTPGIRITPENVEQVVNSHKMDFEIKGKWIRFTVPCFETSDGIFSFTVTPDMRTAGISWLSQMAYARTMLEMKFRSLPSNGNGGIELLYPSYWTLTFQAEFTTAIQCEMTLPPRIFLFISLVVKISGRVEPDWYWSWNSNGAERLSRTEMLQAGIFNIPWLKASLKTERITWNRYHLRVIRSLHESCGFKPNSRDAATELGLPLIKLSPKKRERARSISPERVRSTLRCRRRSSSTSTKSKDTNPTLSKENKESGSMYDYWTELCFLHTYPLCSAEHYVEETVDTVFKTGYCFLRRARKYVTHPMPKLEVNEGTNV